MQSFVVILVCLILLQLPTTTEAHFSSPLETRLISVTARRTTQSPRLSPFGRRSRLLADATTTTTTAPPITPTPTVPTTDFVEDEEDEIPDRFEEAIVDDVSSEKKHDKVIKDFKDLSIGGKLVRGTKNIIVVTSTNFGLGVGFGLMTAGMRGFPNLMTRKEGMLGTPWSEEIPMRLKRYNGKCYRWAKIWGPIFAIWGFTDTAASILRNGENDEFNFMLASAAASLWHNRERTIQRKCIAAVSYAILTYGYVKFTEQYIVGTEGWEEKYKDNNDDDETVLALTDHDNSIL